MNFNVNDFFLLLEADDEEKKEDEKEEKKDDKEKEKEDKSEDELNDLLGDDGSDSDSDADVSDTESKDSSSDDDEFNDLIGDGEDNFMDSDDDTSSDSDEINDILSDSDSSSDDNGDTEINALIISKGGDDSSECVGGVYEKLAQLGYLYYIISNNMYHIQLCGCGKKFEDIYNLSKEYYHHFQYLSEMWLELAAESPIVKLDNVTRAKEHIEDIEIEDSDTYSFEKAISTMSDNFNKAIEYCKVARECAGNTRPDIQTNIDNELRYLNSQFGFKLRKILVPEEAAESFAATAVAANESFSWLF